LPEVLTDWPDPRYSRLVLSKHPSPVSKETGKALWETGGIRLHGSQKALIEEPFRFKKCDGGWRSGKSFGGALALYLDGLWREAVRGITTDLYGVVADTYALAQEEMNHLDRLLTEGGIPHDMKTPDKSAWVITFPHKTSTIVTLSASDAARLASRPYRGLVIAEAAQTSEEVLTNAQGRVLETFGWVMLEGTFEVTKGAWYGLLTETWSKPEAMGKVYTMPSWENLVVFPGGRTDPKILAIETGDGMTPALFLEKCGGVPSKPASAVFQEANDRFHVAHRYPSLRTSYDPELPVFLGVDPGIGHAYAVVAFQNWGNISWAIDAVYRWGRDTEQIIQECADRPWAKNVALAVMDVAGRQRRVEGEPNTIQWPRFWMKFIRRELPVYTQYVHLQHGYELHRRALLNAWPEDEAQKRFNADGLLTRVTNPNGPRLYFDPIAAAPLFGGQVDGRKYAGEYALHRNPTDENGNARRDVPIDTYNDYVKAVNYYLNWRHGIAQGRDDWLDIMAGSKRVADFEFVIS
jgi:hypothetical protein